jgi:hypothetical protein
MTNKAALRKRIARLEKKRKLLIDRLTEPGEMVAGSIYKTYRKCGKPGCRCARGELHGPFLCLSITERGVRRLTHIRREDEEWVGSRAENYREYQKALAQLAKMNRQLLEVLRELRDRSLKTYP